jgi:uncharacterized membrane protein
MIKVLYAGDYAVIQSTFLKGMNSFTFAEMFDEKDFLLKAFREDGEIETDYIPTPFVTGDFPTTMEALSKYDAVLISDVGTDTLLVYPDRFVMPMGPNRLKLLEEYVRQGGGMALIGGWMAFGGYMGQGKYYRTVIEDVLNIDISPFDDRVEVPEGFGFTPVMPGHPLAKDMGWENAPMLFLGYNRFIARDKADVVAEWDNDPMIVAHHYGKGRALAFAFDVAPHWGQGFV